jgi:hypothetical protein
MSTSKEDRDFAMWRSFRSIDIANELGAGKIVLWLAREGTLCAEAKSPVWATKQLVSAINEMLDYDRKIKILIESKIGEQRVTEPYIPAADFFYGAAESPGFIGFGSLGGMSPEKGGKDPHPHPPRKKFAGGVSLESAHIAAGERNPRKAQVHNHGH